MCVKQYNKIVVSADGTFYKATFDAKNGGDCVKKKSEHFLKNSNDSQFNSNTFSS